MKVAIIHDWLTGMRGGEKCLEAFCELYPRADIFTLVHKKGAVSPTIEAHDITTSFVQHLPVAERRYRYYLPVFPIAIERFDLSGYNLVLSSSHCVAKGVKIPDGTCHISYVHTPMRYVWDQYDAYFGPGRASLPVRLAMSLFRPWLQANDVKTSDRVHYYLANSSHVASRIRRFYGRDATVIYPPVDVDAFSASSRDGGYYLMVTAFAPYKRVDLAIRAFEHLDARLKVIGTGQDEERLKRLAGPNIEFCGWQSDAAVRDAYASCRALIFPGEEDFGIVPVEAMASGKPVIAYAKGGCLETVVPLNDATSIKSAAAHDRTAPTGVFFYEQTPEALVDAVKTFEHSRDRFDPFEIRQRAEIFSRSRFLAEIDQYIRAKLQEFRTSRAGECPVPLRSGST